jgi:hypothetical protein
MERVPVWRRLKDGWMTITARFGFVQTVVILAFFYGTLIGPAYLFITVARRDLLDKRSLHSGGSAWREADSAAPDLERAKLLS